MAGIITPIGVLSFPNLFIAKAAVPGAEPRFSNTLIFNKDAQATPEFKALKAAIKECAEKEFGSKLKDPNFVKKLRNPIRPASEKSYEGYQEDGAVFISPWTKRRPGIVGPSLQPIDVADDVWAGQLARCEVSVFAYNTSGNAGISLGLSNVQITKRDMPRMDGRSAPDKVFGKVDSADDEPSKPASDDDDLPF